jgi:hypothetical protein
MQQKDSFSERLRSPAAFNAAWYQPKEIKSDPAGSYVLHIEAQHEQGECRGREGLHDAQLTIQYPSIC